MARMTEEEADALDEYYTKNPPKGIAGCPRWGFRRLYHESFHIDKQNPCPNYRRDGTGTNCRFSLISL